jgi:hypothetical protein
VGRPCSKKAVREIGGRKLIEQIQGFFHRRIVLQLDAGSFEHRDECGRDVLAGYPVSTTQNPLGLEQRAKTYQQRLRRRGGFGYEMVVGSDMTLSLRFPIS